MRPVSRLTAGVCLGLALAACGSTVPVGQQQLSGGAQGDGLSGGTSTSGTGGGLEGSTSGGGSGLGGDPGSVAGRGSTTTGAVTGPGAGSVGSTGATTAPITRIVPGKKPIQVGITYVLDAAAGAQALGIQGATLGDQKRYAQILVDDANKRGGLGGRKIVPVFFGYDVNPGAASYPQQDAVACQKFTQDNRVEIGLINFAGDAMWECLKKRNIPMIIDGPTGGVGEGSLARYRQLVVLGGFNLHRRAAEEAKTLVRQGYFSKWDTTAGGPGAAPVKIGIITYDLPDWKTSAEGPLVDGLVAAGLPKPQVVRVAPHDSYDNLGKMQGQLSSAQLAFRSSGVTHVIIWDDNGVSSLFFMQNAEQQRYRPRYGITSGNNMRLLSSGLVSENQLTGATGMGWVPNFDINEAASPTSKYANSARRACYALMKKHEATGSGFNETSAMMYCSVVTAVKDRWDRMPNPSAAGLIPAIETYGSSFVDPQVPSTFLGPRQHDGLGSVYDYYYDSACSCMKYRGAARPLARV